VLSGSNAPERKRKEKSMAALKDALANLASVSHDLDAELDEVNGTIASVEDSINEAGPGVPVWLHDELCYEETAVDLSELGAAADHGAEGHEGRGCRFWDVGYGRDRDGQWRILAREWEAALGAEGDTDDEHRRELTAPKHLSQCTREVRMEAVGSLERLVAAITERAGLMLEHVRKARTRVDGAGARKARTSTTVKDDLIEKILMQAEWRSEKAEEDPEDERNQQSAEALQALANRMKDVPEDLPQFARIQEIWFACAEEGDPGSMVEAESEVFRLYGFGDPEANGDPIEFLNEFVSDLESAAS
jgi:hypothetical protein